MASEPVAQSKADAESARGRLAETIDALQDRLDPRRLAGDAAEQLQRGGQRLLDRAGSSVRSHPIAIGAAVAAVGIALLARKRLANARVDLGDGLSDYTDYDDGFGFPDASEAAPAADAPIAAAGAAAAPGETENNPLVSMLLGLAAGAALGALLPTSEAERRSLGEAGSRIGRTARDVARQVAAAARG